MSITRITNPAEAKRLIIKIGSALLVDDDDRSTGRSAVAHALCSSRDATLMYLRPASCACFPWR